VRIFTGLLEKLYRGAAKYRCALIVVGVGALALLSLGVSEPARAQVCTPPQPTPDPVTGNATCTGAFNSNINYNTVNTPIHLTASGVSVTSPGGDAVNAANSTAPGIFGADVTLTANNATIHNTSVSGDNNTGLRIQDAGSATITATNTNIDVLAAVGTVSNDGILAIIEGNNPANAPEDVTVTWTGQHITSSGGNSTGIQADNRGNGNASIDASGDISGRVGTSSGFTFLGLDAVAGDTPSGLFLGGLRDIMGVARP
jgi:hypothetical protein